MTNYIDPGTAGMVFGSLGSVVLAALSAIAALILAYFLRPLARLFSRALSFLKRTSAGNVRFILPVAVILIAGYFLTGSMTGNMVGGKHMETGGKVLVIGIDALDAKAMERMMTEGKLPNFGKLRDAGGYSRLETTVPPETPVAWSAAATGANPGKYGIFDFLGRDPKTYMPRLMLSEQKGNLLGTSYKSALKGAPFWKIASDEGVPTTVIRWPVTFPPDQVNGRMLSGLGVVDIRGFLNSYSFYTTEDIESKEDDVGKVVKVSLEGGVIETKVSGPLVRTGDQTAESNVPMKIMVSRDSAKIEVAGKEYDVKAGNWSGWMRAKFSIDFLRSVHGIFKAYLVSAGPEFNMYLTSVQIDPENPVVDISYPRDYAKELASEIGLFYTMGMPEDTKAVTERRIGKDIFLSQVKDIEKEREAMFWYEFGRFEGGLFAFGFDAGDRLQHIFWRDGSEREIEEYYIEKDAFIGKVLERLDDKTRLVIFSDHGFNRFDRAVSVNDWLVKEGYMALEKQPEDGDSGGLFRYVDWEKTKAYSLGFASIYVNLKGREGQGIVDERERDSLVGEIIGKIASLRDPESGKKVVTKAYRREEVYDGPYVGEAPDIIIGFEPGYRMSWQTAVGGISGSVISDNEDEWIGDHLMDRSHVPGVVFANFRTEKDNPSLVDIAPTILSGLGVGIPQEMDGEALFSP